MSKRLDRDHTSAVPVVFSRWMDWTDVSLQGNCSMGSLIVYSWEPPMRRMLALREDRFHNTARHTHTHTHTHTPVQYNIHNSASKYPHNKKQTQICLDTTNPRFAKPRTSSAMGLKETIFGAVSIIVCSANFRRSQSYSFDVVIGEESDQSTLSCDSSGPCSKIFSQKKIYKQLYWQYTMVEHTTKREQTTLWTLTNEKYIDPLQRQKGKKRQTEERERGVKGENKIKLESEEERRARLREQVIQGEREREREMKFVRVREGEREKRDGEEREREREREKEREKGEKQRGEK